MWTYQQSTGHLTDPTGLLIGNGYSGFGIDKNQPEDQDEPNLGPIPQGHYAIGDPTDTQTHGPVVLSLTPSGDTDTLGRGGFLIHGDSILHPGCASHGCIVLPRAIRRQIAGSGDHLLQVIA